jgi:thiol:disulfide interchange protein DsbC
MRTMRKNLAVLAWMGLAALTASAATAAPTASTQDEAFKNLIQSRLQPGSKVISVTKSPYAGLLEVRTEDQIVYTDDKADILVPFIIDAKTRANLVQNRMDSFNKTKFADLPLAAAIKTVKGNGKRVMAVFADPNCGYCKKLEESMREVDNVTVYTFMLGFLGPESPVIAKNIWCSAERSKAWSDWMLNAKAAPAAPADCATPNDQVKDLAKKLKVNGTPAMYFADGSRVSSYLDAKALEQKLSVVK